MFIVKSCCFNELTLSLLPVIGNGILMFIILLFCPFGELPSPCARLASVLWGIYACVEAAEGGALVNTENVGALTLIEWIAEFENFFLLFLSHHKAGSLCIPRILLSMLYNRKTHTISADLISKENEILIY